VLVAEDNRVNQIVTTRILDRLGFRADAASNGREAIEAMKRVPYDLILMDRQMPEMDGFGATRAIRARDTARQPRIIALTANALEGDRERCIAAGMDDYLTKPLRERDLAAMLDRWFPPSPEEAAVETSVLDNLRDLSGDPAFLSGLAEMYAKDVAQRMDEMRRAVDEGNASALAEAAHALKSSSGQIGAKRVTALAARIEAIGRSSEFNGVDDLLAQLGRESSAAQEEIAKAAVARNS
jgi:CheY-like chemotaxis protein